MVMLKRHARLSREDYLKKMLEKGIDKDGYLVPDGTPMQPPVGYVKQPSMMEIMRDMVHSEHMRLAAMAEGFETLEEADDFDIGDDADELQSGYENDLDPGVSELLEAGREALAAKQAEEEQDSPPAPPADGPQDGPESVPESG